MIIEGTLAFCNRCNWSPKPMAFRGKNAAAKYLRSQGWLITTTEYGQAELCPSCVPHVDAWLASGKHLGKEDE